MFFFDIKVVIYFFPVLFRNLTTKFKAEDFIWWQECQNVCYWNIYQCDTGTFAEILLISDFT